ncbi:MAG: excinuclease ABC subunit UvrC [Candidatus Omnitrophica bacterium]|nr:excinuclease ABC subunit UvrC [Candidatus Omnitrophota bacterium]
MKDKRKKIVMKVKELPHTPGVYKFLNKQKEIIYIGKAIDLKKRVGSYFQRSRVRDNRLERLVSEVKDVEFVSASSEAEALIYEAGLIKDHSPKYNIELKDDKSYPFLKLMIKEKYPRIMITRRRINDGSIYYGPYVNTKLLREAVSFMKKVFPLRTCGKMKKKVCLEYHLGQCTGPCEEKTSEKEYALVVKHLKKFLEGKKDDLIRDLQNKMKTASKKRAYEKAIFIKKQIEALTVVQQFHNRSRHPMYGELDELKNTLDLPDLPVDIECFDISNISGSQPVGSMVKFVAGQPSRASYRKFKIKKAATRDDYSMMCEVVRRRYSKLISEGGSLPDFILIDGGRGHLAVVSRELKNIGLGTIPVASIAKEYNHLYTTSRSQPIRLSPGSRSLFLIQRIRDEAHRFAITFHRKLRRGKKFVTTLREINGIGPVKERLLLEKIGSIDKISKLSVEDLIRIGINKKTAGVVAGYFKNSV